MSDAKCQRWRGGEAATRPEHFSQFPSAVPPPPPLLLMLLYFCRQDPAPGPGFTPRCACNSMRSCMRIRTPPPRPPTDSLFGSRDNPSTQEEREQRRTDLSVILYPNYPISPLLVSRGKRTEGCRHKRALGEKGASGINHTYISHSFKDRWGGSQVD